MPVIGMVASLLVREDGLNAGGLRYFVNEDYVAAIGRAGGCPVVLPPAGGGKVLTRQVGMVDGLLLIGGHDVDPLLFGEEPLPELGLVFPDRDCYELAVLRLAASLGKPVLGICRGIQVINVAFGGSLHQDLALGGGRLLQHDQRSRKNVPGHTVEIATGSLLRDIIGEDAVRVNSFHHQAVKAVAPGFRVSAVAADGVIEAIESREASMLGVQWHPEAMAEKYPVMAALFQWLVRQAAGNSQSRDCGGCDENHGEWVRI
jgi:putative glutamine amidotransferase